MQNIFNLDILNNRKSQVAKNFSQYNAFFKHIYSQTTETVNHTELTFKNAINFGYVGLNIFDYLNKNKIHNLIQTDESEESLKLTPSNIQNKIVFNESLISKNILSPNFFNLIISIYSFNNYNNLQNIINYCHSLLTNNAMLVLALPISNNLSDLLYILMKTDLDTNNNFYSRVHPFTNLQTIGSVLQIAGFSNIVALKHDLKLTYKNPLGIFKDLKYTASNNILFNQQQFLLGKKWYNSLLKNLETIKQDNLYCFNTQYAIISAWKN
jgi:hypothetical protein